MHRLVTLPAAPSRCPRHRGCPDRSLHSHHVAPSCANCGTINPAAARFCMSCGSPLSIEGEAVSERRVVSVLFADLVGFTERSDRADPEDVRRTLVAGRSTSSSGTRRWACSALRSRTTTTRSGQSWRGSIYWTRSTRCVATTPRSRSALRSPRGRRSCRSGPDPGSARASQGTSSTRRAGCSRSLRATGW